jgi:hypothetical protein
MTAKSTLALASTAVLVALLVAGCSTQAKRVDCDATLKPINQPDAGGAPAPAAPANLSKSPQAGDEK